MNKIIVLICLLVGLGLAECPAQSDPFASSANALAAKMAGIIFPTVQFENATLEEAVEYLRLKSKDLDTQESRTRSKGVTLVVRNADDKLTAPLISLDLKNVSMTEALRQVTEMTGCIYTVGPREVVVTSRAFKGPAAPETPVKDANKNDKTQISVQVAECVEEKDKEPLQTAGGLLELRALLSDPQRQVILKGMASKKRLTLHPAESKVVHDEVETAFQHKSIPTLKVLVESQEDARMLDLQVTLPAADGERGSTVIVSVWNNQTALLGVWFAGQGDKHRQVWIFVTAAKVDADGKPLPPATSWR